MLTMIIIHYEEENEDNTNWKESFFASSQIDSDDDKIFVMKSLNDCIDTKIIV